MNVVLRQDWQDFVDQLVQDGRYGSAGDAIDEALQLLKEREARIEALRRALIAGEESGPSAPFDFDAFLAGKRRAADNTA